VLCVECVYCVVVLCAGRVGLRGWCFRLFAAFGCWSDFVLCCCLWFVSSVFWLRLLLSCAVVRAVHVRVRTTSVSA